MFLHLRNKLLRTARNTHVLGDWRGRDSGRIIKKNQTKDKQKTLQSQKRDTNNLNKIVVNFNVLNFPRPHTFFFSQPMSRVFTSLLVVLSRRRAQSRLRPGTRFFSHMTAHQPHQFGPPVLRAFSNDPEHLTMICCLSPFPRLRCLHRTSFSTCSSTSTQISTCTLELSRFAPVKNVDLAFHITVPFILSPPWDMGTFVLSVKQFCFT